MVMYYKRTELHGPIKDNAERLYKGSIIRFILSEKWMLNVVLLRARETYHRS